MTEPAQLSETPPFEFGQRLLLVEAHSHKQIEVPCPLCFGKLFVTIILGNNEQQKVECDACGRGYEGPTGRTHEYTPYSAVLPVTVTGMVRYYEDWHIGVGSHSVRLSDRRLFTNAEEAEARRAELHTVAEHNAKMSFESQFRGRKKDATWMAAYHRKCLADLQRQVKWHEAKLCKEPR
jgi:hypothetical protein